MTVRVRVPATSANLGPGFDCFGLALAVYDEVAVTVVDEGLHVEVEGEGADDVPRDESHLVVSSLLAGLEHAGRRPPGLRVSCHNAIPHSRGLGSSAAAIVAGLTAAEALLADRPDRPERGDRRAELLRLASDLEGHADNVAACLHGGFTLAWADEDLGVRATALTPHPEVAAVTCVPHASMSTETARGLLPAAVSHQDAAYNTARAALLVAALTQQPRLLHPATEDRLHQPYRTAAMTASGDLIGALREQGIAAVVSGAGPTVLALVSDVRRVDEIVSIAGPDWRVAPVEIDGHGAETLPA